MASEKWAGFTDEDIERIKSNPKSCADKKCEIDGLTSTKSRGPMKIKHMALKSEKSDSFDDTDEHNSVYPQSKLKEMPSSYKAVSVSEDIDQNFLPSQPENYICNNNVLYEENRIDMTIIPGEISDQVSELSETNYHQEQDKEQSDEDVPCNSSLPPLEIFEMRQKRIEAENARRRTLINKAINDKKMRTHAEAIKLAKITHELNRIDSNLSADVSILRDYIEKASLEFTEAEKRYLKAEKEYVDAKLLLFQKMQRKEMLTEHLCAIIEQNENRKADKLVELMKQLEMEVIVEDFEPNGIEPILSNHCMMNDEPYHSCQTLKPSLSKENSQEHTPEPCYNSDTQEQEASVEESQETTDKDYQSTLKAEKDLSSVEIQDSKV